MVFHVLSSGVDGLSCCAPQGMALGIIADYSLLFPTAAIVGKGCNFRVCLQLEYWLIDAFRDHH